MKQFNMGNSFEQNMPSKIKNEPFWDLGRPTNVVSLFCSHLFHMYLFVIFNQNKHVL